MILITPSLQIRHQILQFLRIQGVDQAGRHYGEGGVTFSHNAFFVDFDQKIGSIGVLGYLIMLKILIGNFAHHAFPIF
jgi:hypothetical protein